MDTNSLRFKIRKKILIKEFKNQFMRTIQSSYACICYPFLWPRSRWSGLHYNNISLNNYIANMHKKNEFRVFIGVSKEQDVKYEIKTNLVINGTTVSSFFDYENLYVYYNGKKEKIDISKYIENGKIIKYGFSKLGTFKIIVSNDSQIKETNYEYFDVVNNRLKKIYYDFLNWFYKYPMQILFCIPKYNELYAMEDGWKNAFGIEMCQEIKETLIEELGYKGLFTYRITDIKEKYGSLRWYDACTTKKILGIINKYENMSYRICGICGKEATKITTGWIYPYCDEHAPYYAIDINEYYSQNE